MFILLSQSKLKELQYCSDMNHSNFAPQSLVPQPPYSQPVSSSDAQTATDWELSSRHQIGLGGVAARNLEPDDLVRSPLLQAGELGQNGNYELNLQITTICMTILD
jgi:hypothetical protein